MPNIRVLESILLNIFSSGTHLIRYSMTGRRCRALQEARARANNVLYGTKVPYMNQHQILSFFP